MKVLALIVVAIALADGKGSGPYIYVRPDGPSFDLPSEIAKPVPAPVVDLSLQGSEASGSDFLREYGPPREEELSLNLLNQGLPDVTIEQTFGLTARNSGSEFAAEVQPETEQTTAASPSIDDESPISVELPIIDIDTEDVTTSANLEPTKEVIGQINQQDSEEPNSASTQETTEGAIALQLNQEATVQFNQEETAQPLEYQQESSTASVVQEDSSAGNIEILSVNAAPVTSEQQVLEVQNIPDIIASLENEILTQQAEVNEAVGEIASVQNLEQLPEGFLEYGPPGFTEYGPPKGDEEIPENVQSVESNDYRRRRRFSPRLRLVKIRA